MELSLGRWEGREQEELAELRLNCDPKLSFADSPLDRFRSAPAKDIPNLAKLF